MLPNFLIAGGVATGTSFLSATLINHPDIYLPRIQRPEPNFFHYTRKFEKGLEWYKKTWFHEIGNQKAIGERSSLLLPSDVSAKRIKKIIPDVKLIFCLRNPIERSWANYRFTVLEGLEELGFDEAVEKELIRSKEAEGIWAEVKPHAYIARSRYASHLQEYIDLFGMDNILVLKSEDLGKYPQENLKRVCEFLDVDSSVPLDLPPNYSSPSVKNLSVQVQLRYYFGERFPEVIEYIRKEKDLSLLVRSDMDQKYIERLRINLKGKKEPLPEASREHLRAIFSDEIAKIKKIVDFSVDDWF